MKTAHIYYLSFQNPTSLIFTSSILISISDWDFERVNPLWIVEWENDRDFLSLKCFSRGFPRSWHFFASWFSIWQHKWHEKTENAVLHEIKLREASIQPLVFNTVMDKCFSTLLCIKIENVNTVLTLYFHHWKHQIVNLIIEKCSKTFGRDCKWISSPTTTNTYHLFKGGVSLYTIYYSPNVENILQTYPIFFWYHIKCFL